MSVKTKTKLPVLCLLSLVLCASARAGAAKPLKRIFSETPEQKAERLSWWTHDRFGLFVHFGLYAIPARGEWVKSREKIPDDVYDRKYLDRFNPDLFDAKDWARRAKAAGMRYAVLTTKHHDGFALWDTKVSDYKITNTAFRRDLVKEFAEAFRAEGLRVGFYFSVMDWHHPDYKLDYNHPLAPEGGFTDESFAKLNEGRDMSRYRAFMFAQVRELLTQYGRIDIMWFDFTPTGKYGKTAEDWDAVGLLKMARAHQPWLIIDNRLGLTDYADGGDFVTPECMKVRSWPKVDGVRVPWETCQTLGANWGYDCRPAARWADVPQLLELLIDTVSHGGNLLLNVGPTARGQFPKKACERLDGFAEWMGVHSRAIYGCTQAPDGFTAPPGTLLTYNAKTNRLYIHLLTYPLNRLPLTFTDRVAFAQFLHDGRELMVGYIPAWQKHEHMGANPEDDTGFLELPLERPDVPLPVVEVQLK